jgi:hypothetical protein
MANTTKIIDRFLEIRGLDEDWTIPGDLAGFIKSGIQVKSIQLFASQATDVLVVKAGTPGLKTEAAVIALTTTAPRIFSDASTAELLHPRATYGGDKGTKMWPFIDVTDCTFGTVGNVRVIFELA